MNKPLVSIAIPAYKANYLREAIESVLNQTYQEIELIIVNDHSPEDISTVVSSYDDDRIRYYINPENIGAKDPALNWEKCLSYAKGEFFCILCDDDLYKPTFVDTLMGLTEEYPNCHVFRARCEVIDNNDNIIAYYASSPRWESSYDYMYHVFEGFRRQTISEFLFKTEKLKELKFIHFPLAWHADYFSVFSLSKEGGIASTNEILAIFRMSGKNISSGISCHGYEKALANNLAYQEAKLYIKNANMKDTQLLSDSLDGWRKNMDKHLVRSVSLSEKILLLFHLSETNMSVSSFIKGFALSVLKS